MSANTSIIKLRYYLGSYTSVQVVKLGYFIFSHTIKSLRSFFSLIKLTYKDIWIYPVSNFYITDKVTKKCILGFDEIYEISKANPYFNFDLNANYIINGDFSSYYGHTRFKMLCF
jgi:hypothetical protein